MKKNLLVMEDLTKEDIEKIIEASLRLKSLYKLGFRKTEYLKDKFFLLLFEKPSTRTRLSFEVAISQLGGKFSTINASDTQLSRGEPIKDFGRVVSRYVDGIIARVKKHESLEELARHSSVPVINALSDKEHPVQVLADIMTIKEKLGRVKNVNLAFIGDGQDNVLNSLMIAAGLMGMNLYVATPKELWPRNDYILKAKKLAEVSGGSINITTNPVEAIKEADVVYTDVWVSMGREDESELRRKILRPYQVNMELLAKSNKKPFVMHCLPAVRGEEITDEVIESPQSIVFDQAENRLHVQKGLLYYLFSGSNH